MSNVNIDLRELADEFSELLSRFEHDAEILGLRAQLVNGEELDEDDRALAAKELTPLNEEEKDRLVELQKLEKELPGGIYYASRNYSLIHESDFPDYAKEMAESTHEVNLNKWPFNCIDWTEAASEIECDFDSVEFEGESYFYQT
jgi:hypothetical protein